MTELNKLRKKIDKIDKKISQYLKKREFITLEIGAFKKAKSLPVNDPKREEEVLSKCESDYEKKIFKKIIEESKKLQNRE